MWYLYFSIYWSASNWGEKTNPQSSASNLMSLIILINMSAILQILLYLGYSLSGLSFLFVCGVPALLIPYLLFRNKTFNLRFKEFEFLKGTEYRIKRITLVIAVLSFSIILNAAVAIFRNIMRG